MIFILILLPSVFYLNARTPEHGLHIRTYPLPVSRFTSLALENGMPIDTRGKPLKLDFELWVRGENVFGTVFRVITNSNENIDLMFSASESNTRTPFLLVGEEVSSLQTPVALGTWLPVSLSLDPESGRVTLQYDGEEVVVTSEKIKGTKSARIAFGHCPFEGFVLDDIASVNIKDVRVGRNGQDIRFWKMAQHAGDTCYDEMEGVPAIGKNTRWIMDDHITWRKIYSQAFDTSPAIAFDTERARFFIATRAEVYLFSPPAGEKEEEVAEPEIHAIPIKGGEYAANAPNQMIYIQQRQQLLSYNLTEDIYSVFNLSAGRWESQKAPTAEHNYWNSTVVFNPADSALVSFGGYGHYLYNNELLLCYPLHENKRPERLHLPTIDPRYSPSSALVGEHLYIFGGRGSPSGRQELAPRNYYDFYSVNLSDKTVKQFWALAGIPEEGDFIPSENMIWDSENECFYVFTSQSGGVLMRIDTVHPTLEPMSLPLDINFDTYHYTYTNLFLSPGRQKLYVPVLLSQVSGESTLEIYEMDYPPISSKSVQQPPVDAGESGFGKIGYALLAVIFLGIIAAITAYYYRRKKGIEAKELEEGPTGATLEASPAPLPLAFEKETAHPHYNLRRECICFLGRFAVFNKNGDDITASFTPTLKLLLIALVCHSAKDSRGISGNKLIQLLWYDKSDEAAKNNRNVYMSKLRTILEEVGDIKIINQNSYWRIQLAGNTVCDYMELMTFFEQKDNHNLEKMLELLTRGAMLPNVETDWVDTFKNDFANTAIDFLSRVLKKFDLTDSLELKIADTLFQYDFLSEEALQIKCSILYRQSKIGLAKTVYDAFCNQYKSSLGTDYPDSFMQVVQSEH